MSRPPRQEKKITPADPTEEMMTREATELSVAAGHAARAACAAALACGLRLIWLHLHSAAQGARNDNLVPHGTKYGFEAALEKVGISKRTAYRWMNAAARAAVRAGLIDEATEISSRIADLEDPEVRQTWTVALLEIAGGMSISRLLLGSVSSDSDEARLEELVEGEEEGRDRACEILEQVAAGQISLPAAMKALGSKEAYDRLRAAGGEKVRRDPVYLDLDPRSGELRGLFPRAATTLANAFASWDDAPEAARRQARATWLDLVSHLPAELRR